MRPYSLDLRERIVAAIDYDEGSIREIARIFRVSTSFIVRLLQRRRATGTLAPEPHGGGSSPALGADDLERLAELVRKHPDATLEQLKQRGGFTCSLKTLWYALDGLGLTCKKKSLHANQQDRPDVQKKRRWFRRKVNQIEPKCLVFVDETGRRRRPRAGKEHALHFGQPLQSPDRHPRREIPARQLGPGFECRRRGAPLTQ